MTKTAHSEPRHDQRHLLGIEAARFLNAFDDYLVRVKGLAPGTRTTYCFWTSRFLATFCGTAPPNWSSLRGSDLSVFVQNEASRLERNGRQVPGVALRALLRSLSFLGAVQDGLEGAIPQRPRWQHVGLTRHLPSADVDRVVAGVLDGSATGLRNYAILLLLARTGLRAHEVAQLSLDDVDWKEGTICIRSRKTRSERNLPLTHDVGAALSDYLRQVAPLVRFVPDRRQLDLPAEEIVDAGQLPTSCNYLMGNTVFVDLSRSVSVPPSTGYRRLVRVRIAPTRGGVSAYWLEE